MKNAFNLAIKQTVHTVLFRVTKLTENEVNILEYRLKRPKILLHFSSQKIVYKTEGRLVFCHFPMWYPGAGVSIPDLCHLSYFSKKL